jgi:hypothetical protein
MLAGKPKRRFWISVAANRAAAGFYIPEGKDFSCVSGYDQFSS